MSLSQSEKGLRKDTNKYLTLVIVISLFLMPTILSAGAAYAIDSYNTSRPRIQVKYFELPVDILQFNLTNFIGADWNVYNLSGLEGFEEYNFTTQYVDNGDYTFYVKARDYDGNIVEANKTFTVDHGGLGVWLLRPKPAIGKTPQFNITVGTQFVATCKYSNINIPCNQTCRYDLAPFTFQETGAMTEHKIVDYQAPLIDRPIFVICKSDVAGADPYDENNFGSTSFMVGYDTSPPSITSVTADPNPVIDVNWRLSTVNVVTNENTVCRIKGGNPNFQGGVIDKYFDDADPSDYANYTIGHEINISYNVPGENTLVNTFNYNITCNDRANWTSNRTYAVIVHLNNSLAITQVTPESVGSTNINYEIKTNVITSYCQLSQDEGLTWTEMQRNTPRNYTLNINLELGENPIKILCVGDNPAYADFTVTADDQPPTMQLLMNDETCSLSHINFEMNASDEGTGIDYLNYSIWEGTDLLVEWTTTTDPTITYSATLNDGETYTVKANAVDESGLRSNTDEKTIIAHGDSSPNCDMIAPVATITFVGDTYNKDVTVNCTDNSGGTGCSAYFDYETTQGLTGSCNNSTYQNSMAYSNLPLQLTQDTFLCVRVSDGKPNYGYANKSVPVQTIVCGNGVVDPGEACDGTDLSGFTCEDFTFDGGILSCNAPGSANECNFNTDNCAIDPYGYCGDGMINNFDFEQCDGSAWGGISHSANVGCQQFGFNSGSLSCNPTSMPKGQRCMFNTSECVKTPANPQPRCDGLGGGITTLLDKGEQCEFTKSFNLTCSDFDSFGGGTLTCTDSCMFDIGDCLPPPVPAVCDNGIIEPGETCDPPGEARVCSEFTGYTGGTATCQNDCQYDFSECIPEPVCGDGVRTGNEICDGNDFGNVQCTDIGGYIGGTLKCLDDCTFDESNCDIGYGYCGDGLINTPWLEQCDGSAWGGISHSANVGCQQFGFTGGTLSCYAPYSLNQCKFDTSRCTGNSQQTQTCGDRILQPKEQCEANRAFTLSCSDFDSYTEGIIGCDYSTCLYDTRNCRVGEQVCGNNHVETGETCDGTDFGELIDCSDIRPGLSGPLVCNPPGGENECQINEDACQSSIVNGTEYCGDGIMNNFPNEQCDIGTNGVECTDLNGYTGGTLGCADDCTFDTTQCVSPFGTGYCGDGELNIPEQCEPGEELTVTCSDLGFIGGSLSCNAAGTQDACMLNIDQCTPAVNLGYCGDGYVMPDEEWCDTNNLGGASCSYFDNFIGGILECDNTCNWDTSNCDIGTGYCGDGLINNPYFEQCDGNDWGRITSCESFGFTGGTLSCYDSGNADACTFDTTQCSTPMGEGPCGNSVLNKGEQCETGMSFDLECTDFDGYIGGTIDCDYATCKYILDGCNLPTASVCGDGFITGGEECDGLNMGDMTLCTQLDDEFTGGTLSCYDVGKRKQCKFDLSDCEYATSQSICSNGIIEAGEECDGSTMMLTCEDFNLGSGFLSCNNDCSADTSNCVGSPTLTQVCGDEQVQPSEECDGEISAVFEQNFVDLYQCQYGLGCSDGCMIECASSTFTNTCSNLIKDGDETGFNCGGSCPACQAGDSCIDNADCISGKCFEGTCQESQCMNGILDGDETGVDCGGSCAACGIGESCYDDIDCQSGRCVDGVCMTPEESSLEKKPNTAGIVLIIIGILLMLSGAGYVIYEEYFDKNRKPVKTVQTPNMISPRPQTPSMTVDPRLLEMQKKRQEERRQKQQEERKSLLEGFDKEQGQKSDDDITELKEKKVNKDVLKEAGYVDLTEEKPEENKSGDIFDKLKRIGTGKSGAGKDSDESDGSEKIRKGSDYKQDDENSTDSNEQAQSSAGGKKSGKSKILKLKKQSDTFEKLGDIGKDVNRSDIRSTSGKISELSGKNKSSITRMLNSDVLSQKQVNSMFSNLDKNKLSSDAFRDIVIDLTKSGKLTKDTVSGMLFEYMDQGVLEKSDVARILSQLNMV